MQRRDQRKQPSVGFVRTFRAGSEDLGARVPAVGCLREKTVAVFGLGALGAPLAIELARNGCRRLHLIDYDVIEPGNGIRWPLGATAWGSPKSTALAAFIDREYPWTDPIPHNHQIGLFDDAQRVKGDAELFATVLDDVDLVVDAAASHGVTGILGDNCRERQLPMISLYAAPDLEGGVVARFGLDGGCPSCLEQAWVANEIMKPRGFGIETGLQQPPGCAERTFTGASYDLQELSLQAVRLAVETLANLADARSSRVFTLSLANDDGRIPPQWDVKSLAKKPDCICNGNV